MLVIHKQEQLFVGAALLTILLFTVELLFLSQQFDAYHLVQYADSLSWRSIFGYFGKLAKWGVLFSFLLGMALYQELPLLYNGVLNNWSWRRFIVSFVVQLLGFVALYVLSAMVFTVESLNSVSAWVLVAWFVCAVVWGLGSVFALLPIQSVVSFFKAKCSLLVIIFTLSAAIMWITGQTAEFWGPLSEATFVLAVLLMAALTSGQIYANFELKELGLNEFAVNIAPACSGYEGIGLVCSFIAIYLYTHKHEFKFPQALLLFPIGALFIWLLNVVRIVVLILIGEHWSPEVAVGGFHSQAGWLTFILASLVILWAASSLAFFSNSADKKRSATSNLEKAHVSADPAPQDAANLAIATLVPMVSLLAVILVTGALSAGFDWLYPLRVIAVGIALAWVWPKLGISLAPIIKVQNWDSKRSLEALALGLVVAVLWGLILSGSGQEQNQLIGETLSNGAPWLVFLWLCFRFIGTTITVPIAEELAFRAYLLCKLSAVPVSLGGKLPISVIAIAASSLAFGFLHGAWFAGTVAGLVYAFVRYRCGHVGYATLSHGFTNALLFAYASATGEWALL